MPNLPIPARPIIIILPDMPTGVPLPQPQGARPLAGSIAARIGRRGLTKFIPYVGWAFTAYEIYELYQSFKKLKGPPNAYWRELCRTGSGGPVL